MNITHLFNAITEALREVDRCPEDSVVDIFNECFEEWETGVHMDHRYNIDVKEEPVHQTLINLLQMGGVIEQNKTLENEIHRLTRGIEKVLDECRHLADGENCTLINLKKLIQ